MVLVTVGTPFLFAETTIVSDPCTFPAYVTGLVQISTHSTDLGKTIETGPDGQIVLSFPEGVEVRLKENTRVSFQDPLHWTLVKGLVGFRKTRKENRLEIRHSFGVCAAQTGILVIKTYPSMNRLAALKGSLTFWASIGSSPVEINAKEEIAICAQETSAKYPALEDLYFAWYWDQPLPPR